MLITTAYAITVNTIGFNKENTMTAKRNGKPRTEVERKVRHQRLYGTSKLPPRGTGRKKG